MSDNQWIVACYNILAFLTAFALLRLMRLYNQELSPPAAPDRLRVIIYNLPRCQEKQLDKYLKSIKGVRVKTIELEYHHGEQLPLAIVTLEDRKSAKYFMSMWRRSLIDEFLPPKGSELLLPEKWIITWAPPRTDIIWENLCYDNSLFSLRRLASLLVFIAMCIFLSTPGHMMVHIRDWMKRINIWVETFLPTIVFSLFSFLLPFLVNLINWYV